MSASNKSAMNVVASANTSNQQKTVVGNNNVGEEVKSNESSPIMSPRLLAQDAVNWYIDELDTYELHSTNIELLFRPVVLALTRFILDKKKRPSWTDYLEETMKADVQAARSHGISTVAPKLKPPPSTTISLNPRTTARMEAFLNGVIWAVPSTATTTSARPQKPVRPSPSARDQPVSLMDGLSGFKNTAPVGASILRSISTGGGSVGSGDQGSVSHPQIRSMDLTIRLELYLRTLFRVVKQCNDQQQQPCVVAAEPPRAMKARVEAIVAAFADTVSTVRQQGPVLTRLITYMTMELLAVSALSEACKGAIRRVVVDYEHQTSFASLAFLSSPEDAADQNLVPLLQRYFATLKENWQTAVRDCELEGMLQNVLDPEMREFFKTVEFQSIGHLLGSCANYRNQLQSIDLPPSCESHKLKQMVQDDAQIRQAIRDLQRERITINGNLLPPVTSRKELIRIVTQTLNSASLTPTSKSRRRKSRRKRSSVRRSESAPALNSMTEHDDETQRIGTGEDGVSEDFSLSSANDESDGSSIATDGSSFTGGRRRPSFEVSTIDMLTERLLLAASRTGTGGDAYFIVRDLFGGKDVQVLASQDLHGAGGAPTTTLELWLHLSSLTIKCHTSFDVYPLLQQDGGNDPYSIVDCCEPLIQLHTTTTEVISLREVRAADAMTGNEENEPGANKSAHDHHHGNFVLQERTTSRTGWRTLSIRPALYEKLQVWTTPS